MKNCKSIVLLPLLLFCSPAVLAQSLAFPDAGRVEALMKEHRVPTVGIGIMQNGKLDTRVFGDLPHHSPAPGSTFFNIASLTKPLTSTVVLMLVSSGKWDLDQPLSRYWVDPEVAHDERHQKLTTRHILSHQSGLPNWRGHEPGGKLTFAFEPGTQWKYSGEGFEYLRQALEHKFKVPIEKLVDSLLFAPLRMHNTQFYWDASTDTSLYANRHREDGSPYELETWNTANPSNLVLTTVSDYAKFGIGVMNHFELSEDVFEEMTTNQAHLPDNKEWGLGWRLIKGLKNGEYALVHTGGNPGLNTIVVLLPESKRGIVVFTNGAKGNQLYERLIEEIFDLGKEIVVRMK